MSVGGRVVDRRIAIIGTGFSGLCAGIKLKERGSHNFVIYEKADDLGGTWRENTYPGAECDVPSSLYSYSFERNPNWTHKWSEQSEILEYMRYCATKHGLIPHIRYGVEVTALTYREESGTWVLETASGDSEEFDVVVSAVGQLHKPFMPEIPGAETFGGSMFHSARWDHSVSLEGKNVVSVGNAASAIQFIPEIAPLAKKLTVFQRSANWIIPKGDREYTNFEKTLVKVIPPLLLLYRFNLWFKGESQLYPLLKSKSNMLRNMAQKQTIKYIDEKIDDPELRKKLVPDYPMGAKRILFSDNIYDALNRDNVEVETDAIDHIEPGAVVTQSGKRHEAEVIAFATGFVTTDFLTPMTVTGKDGVVLNDVWQDTGGAEAYLGITHTGFPNFFMLYGPNTNLGHNSMVVMFEAQVRYLVSCLDALDARDAKTLDVKPEVQKAFNEEMQSRLSETTWAAIEKSWYMNERGKITNNWAGRTTEYIRRTKRVRPEEYTFA